VLIRFFDIFFSFLAIVVLLPFMVPVMIGLKLTGEHYIFYLQPRVGNGGREFMLIKFATMLKDSPNLPGGLITQKDDPRMLPVGRFLRKTKINELPQLINVLLGQMSLVGPRPQAKSHFDLYLEEVKKIISDLKPGVTGIGSLLFRNEEAMLDKIKEDRKDFHDKVITPYKGELEKWYAQNRTIWTYFILIFLTAWSLFFPESRLYRRFFKDLPPPPPALAPFVQFFLI